jgi:hypothetical protein
VSADPNESVPELSSLANERPSLCSSSAAEESLQSTIVAWVSPVDPMLRHRPSACETSMKRVLEIFCTYHLELALSDVETSMIGLPFGATESRNVGDDRTRRVTSV